MLVPCSLISLAVVFISPPQMAKSVLKSNMHEHVYKVVRDRVGNEANSERISGYFSWIRSKFGI